MFTARIPSGMSGMRTMMRQSLTDKLLINVNWAMGVLWQEVNEGHVPLWTGVLSHLETKLRLMFTVHAPMPGLVLGVWVLFALFPVFDLLDLFQTPESLINMFAPRITSKSQQTS